MRCNLLDCIGVRCLSCFAYAALLVFLQMFWKVSTVLAKEPVRSPVFAYAAFSAISCYVFSVCLLCCGNA